MPTPRQDLRRALHAVAFQQAGYFTAAQALEVGYSYQAQKYHADAGNWLRVDRALFRLPEWPADADDIYVRWTLLGLGDVPGDLGGDLRVGLARGADQPDQLPGHGTLPSGRASAAD